MTGTDINWTTPPPRKGGAPAGGGRVQLFIEQLRTRPGEWAIYPVPQANGTLSPEHRHNPNLELTGRRRPDGRFDVYVRWIGDTDGNAS